MHKLVLWVLAKSLRHLNFSARVSEPIDSQSYLPKPGDFLNILDIFTLDMNKLVLIYSKRHLQHGSMPFFPLASCLQHFCIHIHRNQDESDMTYVFELFIFLNLFFTFPFCPFLFLLLSAVIDLVRAYFQFKQFWESII